MNDPRESMEGAPPLGGSSGRYSMFRNGCGAISAIQVRLGSLPLIRASGIRPVLGGANGEDIKETMRGISHLLGISPVYYRLSLPLHLSGFGIAVESMKHDAVTIHGLSDCRILVSQGSHSDI